MELKTLTLLQEVARREGRSLFQYVRDAFPWTTASELEALAQVQKLTEEEREGVARLVQFLVKQHHTFPNLGTYPSSFTNINYISLEHLLPMLADYEQKSITELERDLSSVSDLEAKRLLEQILATKRRHLEALETLAAAYPETGSTVRGQAS
jgi:rubrerythrin